MTQDNTKEGSSVLYWIMLAGLVLALTIGPLFLFGVYTIITSLVGR